MGLEKMKVMVGWKCLLKLKLIISISIDILKSTYL